jgi:hypothetical protein
MLIVYAMTDDQLIDVVKACDNLANPMARRFEGDDAAIVDLMNRLDMKQDLVSKLLVQTVVMREMIARGIQMQRSN